MTVDAHVRATDSAALQGAVECPSRQTRSSVAEAGAPNFRNEPGPAIRADLAESAPLAEADTLNLEGMVTRAIKLHPYVPHRDRFF